MNGFPGLFLHPLLHCSLGSQIPQSVENPDNFGIRWIEVTYYMFALFMPFTCLVVMLVMFLMPLSIKAQSRFFVLAEITNAWSAMEVFVISIIAALLEIQQVRDQVSRKT